MASLSIPAEPFDATSMSNVPSSSTSHQDLEKPETRRKSNSRKKEKNRITAACCGAIITSLTMTPFDVVKTRLQTQGSPESLFIPSSHVPPPGYSSASTSSSLASSIPSHLKGKGKATGAPSVSALQRARSLAATNLATCCQKTYFTTNLADAEKILCRFDPREPTTSSRLFSAASRAVPIALQPALGGGSAALLINSSEACLYPSPSVAAQHLPQLTAPSSRHFAGFLDAITKIVQHEGLPALWRGLSPSLVMSVPSQVMYMVGYDNLRTAALDHAPARFRSGAKYEPTNTYIATTTFVSGSLSRTVVAALLAPLELFRTRIQSTGANVSLSSVTASVRDLAQKEGASSLWRGLSATLWRDVPFSGAYWAGYEAIRRLLSDGRGMGEINHSDKASKTFGVAFASGAGSGMIAAFLTHPFDVVKTRRQTEASGLGKRGTLFMLQEIGQKEGMRGLWRGMVPRVAKIAPACGIMIGAYEIGLRWTGEVE